MLIYWSILVKSKDFCQRFQVSLMLTHAIFIASHNQVSSYLSETILGTGSIGHGGIDIKINPNYQCDKTKDFSHHSRRCPVKSWVNGLPPCDSETQPPFIRWFHHVLGHLNPPLHPLLLTRGQGRRKSQGKHKDSAWKAQSYSVEFLPYSTVQNYTHNLPKTPRAEKWSPAVYQGRDSVTPAMLHCIIRWRTINHCSLQPL